MITRLGKSTIITALLCALVLIARAQDTLRRITLEECYRLSEAHYPLVAQYGLIERTRDYNLENASHSNWPQAAILGQASYQSEVTKLPIQLPGTQVPELSKDQYRIYADLSQTIYDNGIVSHQKQIIKDNAETERQRTGVELYKLRERITQMYFGILLINGQLKQTDLLLTDINAGLEKVNASIKNGTALKSNANVLQAQLLQTRQQQATLRHNKQAYLEMLSLFVGKLLGFATEFTIPRLPELVDSISRPELRLYDLQQHSLAEQRKLLSARTMPRFSLFLQSGMGRPGLNFLNNDFKPYYIGGVRLNWSISSYYTIHRDKALLDVSAQSSDVQREVFLFNTRLSLSQQRNEVSMLQDQTATDNDIIRLRHQITSAALAQLENGVITGSDYLREVDNEDRARQDKAIHELQLLMAAYNYQNTTGH